MQVSICAYLSPGFILQSAFQRIFGGAHCDGREIDVRTGKHKYDFDMPVSVADMARLIDNQLRWRSCTELLRTNAPKGVAADVSSAVFLQVATDLAHRFRRSKQ
jgi:hypothetical protein